MQGGGEQRGEWRVREREREGEKNRGNETPTRQAIDLNQPAATVLVADDVEAEELEAPRLLVLHVRPRRLHHALPELADAPVLVGVMRGKVRGDLARVLRRVFVGR